MKKSDETLTDLLIGIVISTCILGSIGTILASNKLSFVLGILLGTITSILISVHLFKTICNAVNLGEENATKYTKKMAILRLIIMGCAVVVALTFPDVFNTVGTLIGLLGLKYSAYLQPLTNKFITKKFLAKEVE